MEHLPSYVADWDLSQAERGLEAFTQFMRASGAKYEPSSDLHKVLAAYRDGPAHAAKSRREMFEELLMREADKALKEANDARRLFREVGEVRRWRLLTPEQVTAAKANGLKLAATGAPMRRAMVTFATMPIAIGAYVIALRLLQEQGVERTWAWLIALGVWFVVRETLNRTLLRAR